MFTYAAELPETRLNMGARAQLHDDVTDEFLAQTIELNANP